MLDFAVNIVVVIYLLTIVFVFIHSLFDAHLIFHYLKSKKKKAPLLVEGYTPFVTIQLPVFNEKYVVERLLTAVAAISYPAEKLEVQVLDDSTDETSDIISGMMEIFKQKNISIQHIRRTNRDGFKAGALKHALSLARGEYLAIFDADFIPSHDFLDKTIPHFTDPAIGMVQTRWGHLNKKTSLLAKLQALALDGHFSVEQQGRNKAGYFINFNGTAGIWRKQAILDAGNWQSDTLTEDFDLSYRAQMKGWQFKYLENFITPAELPPVVSALRSQQFRWTKGGAETARKNIRVLATSRLPVSVKLHGIFHLIYSFGFISIILYSVLTVPLLFVKESYPQYLFVFKISGVVGLSFLIYIVHYFISYYNYSEGTGIKKAFGFVVYFPLFVSLFIGLSLSNAIGIIQGYLGIRSGFVRTPKFNSMFAGNAQVNYAVKSKNWLTVIEAFLVFYFLFGLIQAFHFENYKSVPLLLMALSGFTMIMFYTFKEKMEKTPALLHDRIT